MRRHIIAIFTFISFLASICDPATMQGVSQVQSDSASTANSDISPLQVSQEAGKISLDLKGMDVIEVIKMLAAKGNLNVVLGPNVKGRVTIFLKSVNLIDALDIILVANDLAYDKRGDIIYIMSQRDYEAIYGEKYSEKKEVFVFNLKYAKAADIGKALTQMKTKAGKIIVDEGSNTVVAVDNPMVITKMSDMLASLDIPTKTKVFDLKYAKVADLKDKITERLTKGLGTMQIDERTNKIAITDVEKKLEDIENVLTAFDDRPQQVLIEAKIVEVSLDDRLKLGVDWDTVFQSFQKEINMKSAFQLAAENAFLPPGAQLIIGSLGSGDMNVMIQVLKTIGDTNLLSSPRITAINNQEAKILVGSSQPYATNTVTQTTGTATTGTNISFLDIGVKLFVTPTINKDGFITMKIRPEVSSTNSNYTYGTPSTTIPIVQTTQAETSVTIKDGTTIIIGGLITDQRTETVSKLPILGDLPMIKYAFRKTDVRVEKKELVIFLTPHIVTGDNDLIEQPKSPPIGEGRFTVPEAPPFERREKVLLKPGVFRKGKMIDEEYADTTDHGDQTQKISVPASSQEYYYTVKNKIVQRVALPKDVEYAGIRGKVRLAFFLNPSGKIVKGPDIIESSNHTLDSIAINAVKRASPFSAFPAGMGKKEKRFIMDLIFE